MSILIFTIAVYIYIKHGENFKCWTNFKHLLLDYISNIVLFFIVITFKVVFGSGIYILFLIIGQILFF